MEGYEDFADTSVHNLDAKPSPVAKSQVHSMDGRNHRWGGGRALPCTKNYRNSMYVQ